MLMWFSDLRLIGIFIICFHWLCCMFLFHSVPIFKAFWHTVDRVSGWLAHLHCVAAVRNISNRVTRVSPVLFLFCKPSCARYATSNNPSVFLHHQRCASSHSSIFSFNLLDTHFIFRIVFSRMPTAWSHPQHGLYYYLLSARTPEKIIPPTLPIYKPLGDMRL